MNPLLSVIDHLLPLELGNRDAPSTALTWLRARLLIGSALAALVLVTPAVYQTLASKDFVASDGVYLAVLVAGLALPLGVRWHRIPLATCAALCVIACSVCIAGEAVAHGTLHTPTLFWLPVLIGAACYFVSTRFGIWLAAGISLVMLAALLAWSSGLAQLETLSPEQLRTELLVSGPPVILLAAVVAWLNDRSHRQIKDRLELMHRQLQANQTHLVEAYRLAALGELAGGIAHEINNPLAAMQTWLGQLELMARDGGDLRQGLAGLSGAIARIKRVVQVVRQYAGVDEPHEAYPVALSQIVSHAVALLGARFRQGGVEVHVKVADDLMAVGQLAPLTQALVNLLVNAVQAVSGREEARIVIAAERDGTRVRLAVEDTGPGVPESIVPRIFDPFFTTRDPGAGFGLGLSVSQGIVQRAGGRLYYEERVDGSRFVIELPLLARESSL